MRVMIFIDDSNFRANMKCVSEERKQDRVVDFYKLHRFVLDYLSQNPQYKNEKLIHIRTYFYTGEYTNSLSKRIKEAIKECKSEAERNNLNEFLEKIEKRKAGQKSFFYKSNTYNFFEVRKKPLQFSKEKGIFQKGIDVQLAVDLVSNAYLNNYDIAVLFSGDIDLIESLKLVKSKGKHIIVFSHCHNIAKEMLRESDLFVDFQKIEDGILNKFSHIFEKHKAMK